MRNSPGDRSVRDTRPQGKQRHGHGCPVVDAHGNGRILHEVPTMSGTNVTLLAGDPNLTSALAARLPRPLAQTALVIRYDAIQRHLTPDAKGLVVLAAAWPADSRQVLQVVQAISLRQLAIRPLLVLAAEDFPDEGLSRLEPHLAGLFRWPDDA